MKVSTQSLTLCTVLIAATLLNNVEASDRGMVRNGRVQRKRKLINVVADLVQDELKQPSEIESIEMVDIENSELARTLMEMSMSMSMPAATGEDTTDATVDTVSTAGADSEETADTDGENSDNEDESSPSTVEATSRENDSVGGPEGKLDGDGDVADEAPNEGGETGERGAVIDESSASSRKAAFAAAASAIVLPMLF